MTAIATRLHRLLAAAALFTATTATQATVIYDATTGASAIMGYISVDDPAQAGVLFTHPFNGSASEILDGDTTSWIDNYSGTEVSGAAGNDTAPLDFVGVLWGAAQSDIVAIRLYHQLFFDGGWFGTAAGDPNAVNQFPPNDLAHNTDDANDVAAPTVQVTSDGGSTWSAIAAIDDYVSVIAPIVLAEGRANETPVTFEFAAQSGINGLRLVGYGGGRSDIPGGRDEQGFIGVAEFEVGRFVMGVPEPGTLALLVAAVTPLAARRRRAAA